MGTAELRAERIAGGFVRVDVAGLAHAWRACLDGPPGAGGFRAWLACHEMLARRRGTHQVRTPRFDVAELSRLTGTTTRTAAASLRRVVAAGLVAWSEDAIGFPAPQAGAGACQVADTIGGGRGSLTVPRRLLRWLARGARPALIATALGALLRCLGRRRAGFAPRGRFKSSWIAQAFGVAERHARAARAELVALGWLEPDLDDSARQWAWNRWGRAFLVRLEWRAPRGDRPTLQSGDDARSSYPDLQPGSSPERESDPEPSGQAGASLGQEGGDAPRRGTHTTSTPDLRDIKPEDLANTARALELHRQAAAAGKADASEAGRVRFLAAVEHAKAVGRANPPGLLAKMVSRGWWHLIAQADEDRASRRLREHRRSAPSPLPWPVGIAVAPPQGPGPAPAIRSPYGAERPGREPSALGELLARLVVRPGEEAL